MRVWWKAVGLSAGMLAAWGCPEEEPTIQCTEIECAGGFDLWMTSTNESAVFDAGRYDIWVTLYGGEVYVRCDVDASGSGSCNPPQWETPASEDITVTATFGLPDAQQAITTPAIQLTFVGNSEAPAGTNVYGPTMLEVEVERNTLDAIDPRTRVYSPEYERFDDYFGEEDCGFCESREREVLRLDRF